ncbi:MAG: hypothetical protein DRQ51_10720 [Gammaproteobacteria bacterium]|nr:MAG: hypothetical protein DRQ51_10720 [Gammaproteobacteria bacterium]
MNFKKDYNCCFLFENKTMQAIYHANLNEITFSFFEKIKKQYSDAKVDIVINDSHQDSWDSWGDEELKQVGKIGLHSQSFVDDSEDYSKW